eukprot:919223_1
MSSLDTRVLAWGGFLSINDQKSAKDNRWILIVNIEKREIIIVQHEQQHARYPFDAVLCTFANLKWETALMIFWKNAKPPLQFFFDSASDRDSVQQILESIPKNTYERVATTVGCIAEFSTLCEKKGKMKWTQRHIILVKSRILVFRDSNKSTSIYPLQMISLLEPNIQIEISQQYPKTVDIYAQEKHIFFKLDNVNQVRDFVDKMSRTREKMTHEANAFAKLQMLKLSESKRNMMQKSMVARQDYVSRREISSRRFNPNNIDSKQQVHKIMLQNGSTMSFKGLDANSMTDLGSGGLNSMKRKGKRIKFDKAFKPGKHKADIFMWGKPRPPRLFPKHSASPIPFQHQDLSKKRFVLITTAKDGTHCMGMTDNDWSFVWGEANFTGALGLGPKVKSTLPYLLKSLRKKNIIQVSCSARHGLAITVTSKAFGWGSKGLTGLDYDTQEPQPLNFLDNLGILAVDCCGTHSVAYSTLNMDVYQFGMIGPWLGIQDRNKSFGKVIINTNTQNNNIAVIKVCIAQQYSMYLLSNGMVYTTGVNEHGRMGCSKDISESTQPIRVKLNDSIGEMSCASFHCGFISFKNKLYTCGVGNDYRLGHENENTYYEPTYVQNLSQVKCARVECVEDRTFITTKYGAVLMFGVEPVTRTIYKKPFVFEFLRTHRIYQVCGAKDFTIALGVQAKEQVLQPNVESDQNYNNDMKMGNNYNDYTNTAANTINQTNVIGNNAKINTVINPEFVQSSYQQQQQQHTGLPQLNSSGTGPPPMVPLDAHPGFTNMAKPLPEVVPASNPYQSNNNNNISGNNNLPGQLPNPFAANNGFAGNGAFSNRFGPPPPPGPPGPPANQPPYWKY